MMIGILAETFPGEKRVSLTPKNCSQLVKAGFEVMLEPEAGMAAGFPNEQYISNGSALASDRRQVFERSDIIVQVRGIGVNPLRGVEDVARFRRHQIIISLCNPLGSRLAPETYAYSGVTSFALELIPRITKAQNMDVLSSQATLIGYHGVLLAATNLPKIFPMLMTAAGSTKPAKVLVIGAGVTGLQAIATAKRLGAVVHAYDVRPAAIEQIQSVGAKAIQTPTDAKQVQDRNGYAVKVDEDFLKQQREHLAHYVAQSDVVICTAAVPGQRAPLLISEEAVMRMAPGSIVVDLVAESGGNCDLTEPSEEVEENGVRVLGPMNLASHVAYHASEMFSQNLTNFIRHAIDAKTKSVRIEDEVVRDTLLTHEFQVVNQRVRDRFGFGDYCVLSPLFSKEIYGH